MGSSKSSTRKRRRAARSGLSYKVGSGQGDLKRLKRDFDIDLLKSRFNVFNPKDGEKHGNHC